MIYWNEKCKKWCFLQKDAVGIADVGQVEAVGGHGLTCGAAVVGVDGGAHLVDSHGTTADLEERADNGADHVTEEAVGLNSKNPTGFFNFFIRRCLIRSAKPW